jgi:hypothetical protein
MSGPGRNGQPTPRLRVAAIWAWTIQITAAITRIQALASGWHATGLTYRGGAVSGVRYPTGDGEQVETGDFVVDAMGRASRISDWLEQDGLQEQQEGGVRRFSRGGLEEGERFGG